jgi:hypothetical protein
MVVVVVHCRLVLCGVGLTVAFGAMVLVPFTILGHEAMASYGDSWYVKWISYSLILGTLLSQLCRHSLLLFLR